MWKFATGEPKGEDARLGRDEIENTVGFPCGGVGKLISRNWFR